MSPSHRPEAAKSQRRWWAAAVILLLLAWLYFPGPWALRPAPMPPAPPVFSPEQPPPAGITLAVPATRLAGELILRGFADASQPPAQDLTLLHHCLDTFLLAAKGMKDQPLSANGEIAAALRGEGRVKLAFLPRSHPIFNEAGQLTDRWGTPFFFHAEAAGVIAIRSAGPDKTMGTPDDLQRQPNGIFLRGEALNPARPD